ncbi:MAG TPA: DUF423 domain-containing protein [Burkholderiales bacterium]|nr:DUF423 domain-containing protein [Burkholderiales bacterium]
MLAAAALLAALAVALGAFGAHALKQRLAPDALALWHTAVQYHVWHSIGLLALGVIALHGAPSAWLRSAAGLFVLGILLFCGSLYALALGAPRALGMVTPFGGLAFIAAWLCLGIWALR